MFQFFVGENRESRDAPLQEQLDACPPEADAGEWSQGGGL